MCVCVRSLYRLVGAGLQRRPGLTIGLVLGAGLHATGHAFLAGAAGALARGLVGAGHGDNRVVLLAAAGVGAAGAKLLGGALAASAEARLGGAVAAAVRLSVLDHVLAVESRGRGAPQAGTAVSSGPPGPEGLAALTTHVSEVERGVVGGVVAEVRAAIALVPLGCLLVFLAPRLALSAVVALGAFGLLAFSLRRAFKRSNARVAATAGALVGAADEAVRHAELWATYGAKDRIAAHVARLGDVIAREHAALRVRSAVLSSTSEVLGAVALVLVLLLAGRGLLGVDDGTVVPFAIAFFMTYRPLRDLVDARLVRARAEASLAAMPLDGRPREEPSAVTWKLEPLVLDAVTTPNGDHAPLSLRIAPGSITVIVGPTGAGKTSLLRALLGLGPHGGSIRWGAHPLAPGVGPHVRPFAWVPQDAPVVRDTLAVNVRLGGGAVDPATLLAELGADLVLDDEILGERPLSGGERQWVAMARALATGLPVLLLDEPTSALDPEAQARLLAAIGRLRGRRTVLLVTHRAEPLAIADVVVRLQPAGEQETGNGQRATGNGERLLSACQVASS